MLALNLCLINLFVSKYIICFIKISLFIKCIGLILLKVFEICNSNYYKNALKYATIERIFTKNLKKKMLQLFEYTSFVIYNAVCEKL